MEGEEERVKKAIPGSPPLAWGGGKTPEIGVVKALGAPPRGKTAVDFPTPGTAPLEQMGEVSTLAINREFWLL